MQMNNWKSWVLAATFMLCGTIATNAQSTDLTGRVYYNKNIMADELNELTKEVDKSSEEARKKAYTEGEKKLGRKLTNDEKAELEKKLTEARQMTEALKKGTSMAITVEFKSATDAVMKMDMKVSDEALKAAGVSWLKRKAMKAALAVAPSSEKIKYEVKGKLIITTDSEGKDTLTLSADGKHLYGKTDKNEKFTLTRTK